MMTTLLILSAYIFFYPKAYGVLRFLSAIFRQSKWRLSNKCVAN